MPSSTVAITGSIPASTPPGRGAREARRLQTRARVRAAALEEIARAGLAGADVGVIAAAAGVARGTFYFHYPTKAHVLVELEQAEEQAIVAKLRSTIVAGDGLATALGMLARLVFSAERRLGPVVFRDMLGLHFSSERAVEDGVGAHPLAEYVIASIAAAQAAGDVTPDTTAADLGVIFLTGLFALLATGAGPPRSRAAMVDTYVTTLVRGMEAR